MKKTFLTSECLIPTLLLTDVFHLQFATGSMSRKKTYEQRCREVKHSSFTPLVISATGGLAREATVFYKRLASACL